MTLSVTPQDLTGKNVIVTGANIGIGLETARMLAAMHASVILVCRNSSKGEAAVADIKATTGNQNVECWTADFASLKSVRSVAQKYLDTGKPLDILVNNAGLTSVRLQKTEDGHEMTFQVNHLAPFLLTHLLLPALKKGSHPRVVNVSSTGHLGGVIDFENLEGEKEKENDFSFFQFYKNTKLMNVLFTAELARRFKSHEDTKHIITHSLHPGFVMSDIWFKEEYKQRPFARAFLWVLIRMLSFMALDTVQGAMTSVYVAVDPEVGKVSGLYYDACKEKEPAGASKDEVVARKLWEVSAKAVEIDANII